MSLNPGPDKGPLFTPNQITTGRLVLVFPLFAAWFLLPDPMWRGSIAALFGLIFIGDNWDGIIARRYQMTSTWGAYLDPVVDHITYFALKSKTQSVSIPSKILSNASSCFGFSLTHYKQYQKESLVRQSFSV